MFIDNKIPYQFGDPRTGDFIIFDCNDLGLQYSPQIKTEKSNSDLFDGEARLNGADPNNIGETVVRLRFSLKQSSRYTQDYVLKLFTGGLQKFFVYEEGEQNNIPIQSVLWQYAECTSLPQVFSGINEKAEEYKTYDVELALINPEWYQCDGITYYQRYSIYPISDGTYTSNGAITSNQYEVGSFPSFPTNISTQFNLLSGRSTPLSVKDKYYKLEDYSVSSSISYLTQTLTTNTATYIESTGLDLNTSRPSRLYLIQINALAQNEYVEIENIDTVSDIRITWLYPTANTNDLLLNSVDNLLYDPTTQTQIPPDKYAITSAKGELLYFSPKLNSSIVNSYRTVNKLTNSLRLQKSSSTNNQIRITTLKTFI